VLHAEFPNSPGWSLQGVPTVVLEVTLSAKGEVEETSVLRDIPSVTPQALAVVGSWRFMPATWNGHPVPSKIILAFVFRPFAIHSFRW
jgi:outer membrane biosynthesis protein TonB